MGKLAVHGEAFVIFREAEVDYYLPSQLRAIGNNEGMLCSSLAECMRRWREHFDHVLNAPGQFLRLILGPKKGYLSL